MNIFVKFKIRNSTMIIKPTVTFSFQVLVFIIISIIFIALAGMIRQFCKRGTDREISDRIPPPPYEVIAKYDQPPPYAPWVIQYSCYTYIYLILREICHYQRVIYYMHKFYFLKSCVNHTVKQKKVNESFKWKVSSGNRAGKWMRLNLSAGTLWQGFLTIKTCLFSFFCTIVVVCSYIKPANINLLLHMSAMDTKTKGAISLKGSAQLVQEFFREFRFTFWISCSN